MARARTGERTINFHEAVDLFSNRIPGDIDFGAILDIIESLDPETEAYHDGRQGMHLHGRVARGTGERPDMLVLGRLRSTDLPALCERGRYSELEIGPADLAETTHVAFFPRNVVGVMRGPEGPFPSRVEEYIRAKVELDPEILIRPLVNRAVANRLGDAEYIRRFAMKLPSQYADRLPQDSGLRPIIRAAHRRYGAVDVELIIKVPTRGSPQASEAVREDIEALLGSAVAARLERAEMTYVDRSTNKNDAVDFLSERVAITVEVSLDGNSRRVQDASASQQLAVAYDILLPEIEAALGGDE